MAHVPQLVTARMTVLTVEARRQATIPHIAGALRIPIETFMPTVIYAAIGGIENVATMAEWTMGDVIDQTTARLIPEEVFLNRNTAFPTMAGQRFYAGVPNREAALANFRRILPDRSMPALEKVHVFIMGARGIQSDYDVTGSFLEMVIDVLAFMVMHDYEQAQRQALAVRNAPPVVENRRPETPGLGALDDDSDYEV